MSFHVVFGFWTVMTRFVISGSGQVFSGLAESTAFPIVRSGSWSRSSAGFAIYQVRALTQFDIKNYLAKCLNLLASTFAKKHQMQMKSNKIERSCQSLSAQLFIFLQVLRSGFSSIENDVALKPWNKISSSTLP